MVYSGSEALMTFFQILILTFVVLMGVADIVSAIRGDSIGASVLSLFLVIVYGIGTVL